MADLRRRKPAQAEEGDEAVAPTGEATQDHRDAPEAEKDYEEGGRRRGCAPFCSWRWWRDLLLASIDFLVPSLDLRGLAVCRMLMGLLMLREQAFLFRWQKAFLTDEGICPRATMVARLGASARSFDLYHAAGSTVSASALQLVNSAAAACLVLGYCTGPSAWAVWAFRQGLRSRCFFCGYGGDGLINGILICLACLPAGERYSVDAFLRGGGCPGRRGDSSPRGPLSSCAVIILYCWMYGVCGGYKHGRNWTEGSAVAVVLQSNMAMSHFLARWLAGEYQLCSLLTHLTVLAERYGWYLLLLPHWLPRIAGCAIFIGFHAGLFLMLDIDHFQPTAIAGLLACLPAPVWDAFDGLLARPWQARACRHLGDGLALLLGEEAPPPAAAAAASASATASVSVAADSDEDAAAAAGGDPATATRAMATAPPSGARRWRRRAWALVDGALGIILVLLMLLTTRDACRELSAHLLEHASGAQREPLYCRPLASAHEWAEGLATRFKAARVALDAVYALQGLSGLPQRFDMFSPHPVSHYWWIRLAGITRNGTLVSIFNDGEPTFDPAAGWGAPLEWLPEDEELQRTRVGLSPARFLRPPATPFAHHRWLKVFEHRNFYKDCAIDFGRWVCREWNRERTSTDPLALALFRVLEFATLTQVPAAKEKNKTTELRSYHGCRDEYLGVVDRMTESREYSLDEVCDIDRQLNGPRGGPSLEACAR